MPLHCGENRFHGEMKVTITRPVPGSILEWLLLLQEVTQKMVTARNEAETSAKKACAQKCQGRRQEGGSLCREKRAYWSLKPALYSFRYDPFGPVHKGHQIQHEVEAKAAVYWRAWVFCEPSPSDFSTAATPNDGTQATWDDSEREDFPAVPYWD